MDSPLPELNCWKNDLRSILDFCRYIPVLVASRFFEFRIFERMLRYLRWIFFLQLGSIQAQHTEIPNGGFEDWVNTGTYFEPYYWNTFNILSEFGCSDFIRPDSQAFAGKVCARIATLSCFSPDLNLRDTLAGILFAGERDAAPGFPCNTRPANFSFQYRYYPSPGDTAVLALVFRKIRGNRQEDIGVAYLEVSDTVRNWTAANLPVWWRTNETPDTVQVVITSSKAVIANRKPRQPGSVLWVDEVKTDKPIWETPVSTLSAPLGQLRFYPNPAGMELSISAPTNLNGVYVLSDSRGLIKAVYPAGTLQIPLDHLSAGVYFLSYSGPEGRKVERIVHTR